MNEWTWHFEVDCLFLLYTEDLAIKRIATKPLGEIIFHYFHFVRTVLSLFVCLFGFYGISTFVGYLMPNPFLYT